MFIKINHNDTTSIVINTDNVVSISKLETLKAPELYSMKFYTVTGEISVELGNDKKQAESIYNSIIGSLSNE